MRRRAMLAAAGTLAAAITVPTGRAFAAQTVGPVLDHRIEKTYDGRSYTDLSAQVAAVRGLTVRMLVASPGGSDSWTDRRRLAVLKGIRRPVRGSHRTRPDGRP